MLVASVLALPQDLAGQRFDGTIEARGSLKGEDKIMAYHEGGYITTTIQVGNPAQDIHVIFDTGASELYVVCTSISTAFTF